MRANRLICVRLARLEARPTLNVRSVLFRRLLKGELRVLRRNFVLRYVNRHGAPFVNAKGTQVESGVATGGGLNGALVRNYIRHVPRRARRVGPK